ncbi:achaete-scute homolog 5 [Dipodomys merriami]|uniref:achaete-scute homolog 5 n=1 Tax=Dipodomys merriami TaxID=94247 RepID=UPI003856025B
MSHGFCRARAERTPAGPPGGTQPGRSAAPPGPSPPPAAEALRGAGPFLLYPGAADPYAGVFPCLPFPGALGVYDGPFEPAFIQKRNERERQRVRCVNAGYARLRGHLPGARADKRLSKVETLRAAIRYIKHLQGLLGAAPDGAAPAGAPEPGPAAACVSPPSLESEESGP